MFSRCFVGLSPRDRIVNNTVDGLVTILPWPPFDVEFPLPSFQFNLREEWPRHIVKIVLIQIS